MLFQFQFRKNREGCLKKGIQCKSMPGQALSNINSSQLLFMQTTNLLYWKADLINYSSVVLVDLKKW